MDGNQLFPIFLCVEKLSFLIIGGGAVGWEKVGFMFRHTQAGNVTLLAKEIRPEIKDLASRFSNLELIKKSYHKDDLDGFDVVIAATDDRKLNEQIRVEAKEQKLLVNVADTPDLCDFYLSSVVKKGDLKVAISSNGKSPTLTKRMRQFFEEVLPEDINDLLENLNQIRDQVKGDFEEKVKKLNKLTSELIDKKENI